MLQGLKLTAALSKAKRIAVHGPWTRIIGFRHLLRAPAGKRGTPEPLWGGASKINGARFTPKGSFDSIYLAWEPVTALQEVQALILIPGTALPLRTPPWALVAIDGIVSNVLDLTDDAIIKALGTNDQEMTGSWATVNNPPTQALAHAAYESRAIAGIKYGSAKNPGGMNLVVFPDRLSLSPSDYLEVFDPYGHLSQRIGN